MDFRSLKIRDKAHAHAHIGTTKRNLTRQLIIQKQNNKIHTKNLKLCE